VVTGGDDGGGGCGSPLVLNSIDWNDGFVPSRQG